LIGQNYTNIMITVQSCKRGKQSVFHSCQVFNYRLGKSWWRSL